MVFASKLFPSVGLARDWAGFASILKLFSGIKGLKPLFGTGAHLLDFILCPHLVPAS
jgi:hypothetical protein